MKAVLRKIYRAIPFKKQIYLILKRIYKPGTNIYQHLHFVGDIDIKVTSQRNFNIRHYGHVIENELFWNGLYGGWEKLSLRLWSELCEEAQTIFDIGANTGVYALLAKTIKPSSKVYAFEPIVRVYDKLTFNNDLNNYDIKCVNKAISSSNGSAIIYDEDTEYNCSATLNKDVGYDPERSVLVDIETIRADTFIEQNNIPKIDLIKIDIERHEVEALEGFGKYLKVFEPTLLIEILDNEIAKGIQQAVSGIHYDFYNINENSGIRKVSELSKSDSYNYLICKPQVAEKLEVLKRFTQNV